MGAIETVRVVVGELDDGKMLEIAAASNGWMRSSGAGGDRVTVWLDGTEYVFTGPALVELLFAIRDHHMNLLHRAGLLG